jgi:predicted nucleic acid-binding protein
LATCGVVKAEIFPFAGGKLAKVERYFLNLLHLPFEDKDWDGLIGRQMDCLKHLNHPCEIPDLIIICTAKIHGAELFTKDKTMKRAAEALGVKPAWALPPIPAIRL